MATESTYRVLDYAPGYLITQVKIRSKRFSKEMTCLTYYKWIDLLPIKLDSIYLSKDITTPAANAGLW